MRRRIKGLSLALILCMALLLCGCAKKQEVFLEAGGGTEASEETKIQEEPAKESEEDVGEPEESAACDEEKEPAQKTDDEAGKGKQDVQEEDKKDGNGAAGAKTAASGIAYPSVSGALHVEGTRLTDENGNPVQLRGISTHNLAWYPEYVNEACFQGFRDDWEVNVIRLSMYTAESGGYCVGGDRNALKGLVEQGVEYATRLDMYVIIDWHILSDGNPNTYKAEAKKFFAEMSERYAEYNNVLYEICNEPNGGVEWSAVKSYAEEIIPIIRANDDDAVILVGTPNWSQYVDQAAADPITDYDNVMYTLHFYAATHREDLRNTMIAAVEAGLPVFVSEYGICDASGNGGIDEGQADMWIGVLNEYGISYVAWNLSNKNESSAIISSNCNKTSGFGDNDLSTSGKWLYRTLTGEYASAGLTASGDGGGNGGGGNGNGGAGAAKPSVTLTNGDIAVTAVKTDSWESNGEYYYNYSITLQNVSGQDCGSWEIVIPFNGQITLSNGWCGNFAVDGSNLKITSVDYNGNIPAGGTVKDIGFIIIGSKNLAVAE